jgi:uncharacterized protein YlxW (UPF0749 family)
MTDRTRRDAAEDAVTGRERAAGPVDAPASDSAPASVAEPVRRDDAERADDAETAERIDTERGLPGGETRESTPSDDARPSWETPAGAATSGAHRFKPVAPSGGRRLWEAITKRPQTRHLGVAALVCLLGFAAVVQVRGDEEDALANARRDELLQIYDGLSRQADRLEEEIGELRRDRDDLISSADSEGVALEQAQERQRQLEIIAGTAEATGPGIQMTVSDPAGIVHENRILAAFVELRSAGAEAIQIEGVGSGNTVRVVADTYVLPGNGGIVVAGVELRPTYVITAIGDPESLDDAMHFLQGVVSKIESDGGEVTVTQFSQLTVDAIHEVNEPQYLRPAPEDD